MHVFIIGQACGVLAAAAYPTNPFHGLPSAVVGGFQCRQYKQYMNERRSIKLLGWKALMSQLVPGT